MSRRIVLLASALSAMAVLALAPAIASARRAHVGALRFVVKQPRGFKPSAGTPAGSGAVPGRMFVFVSRDGETEPRLQTGGGGGILDGIPFWGHDVRRLGRGGRFVLRDGRGTYGYPLTRIGRLPAGRYFVQAYYHRYAVYHTADGRTLALPTPCGDGGAIFRATGSIYSDPKQVTVRAGAAQTIHLRLTNEVAPLERVPKGGTCSQGNSPSSAHVKHVKLKSAALSRFWGRPMYIAADVLLPQGYDDPANAAKRYPLLVHHGRYPFFVGTISRQFDEQGTSDFSKFWLSDDAPRAIMVELREENPYAADSYSINTPNKGPWGDAVNKELLPLIERTYRTIGQRWARVVYGGSNGGYEALASQLFYPDVYQGAFAFCADPPSFHRLQLIDVYRDDNALYNHHAWLRQDRTSGLREGGFGVDTTLPQEIHYEAAKATHGRALGVWQGDFQASFSPVGRDGYVAPIWDPITGAIDHKVAQAWRAFDLTEYLKANWSRIGPLVVGNVEHWIDNGFYYQLSSRIFERAAAQLTGPPASFVVHDSGEPDHCGTDAISAEPEELAAIRALYDHIADHVAANAPAGADLSWRNG